MNSEFIGSIALQLKVIMAIGKKKLNSSLHDIVSNPKAHAQTVECFESAVTDITSYFCVSSSQSEGHAVAEDVEKYCIQINELELLCGVLEELEWL